MKCGLSHLEKRLAEDLTCLDLPAAPWVPERQHNGQPVRDVLIVGAGMCGLAALAQLRMLGVTNCLAIDAAAEGQEGPWETFARMRTLRSPKTLTGPALDLPALTFQAWFKVQCGAEAWGELDNIPKSQWMDYLRWYRRVLRLPVENGTQMTDISDVGNGYVAVNLTGPDGQRREIVRHLVLATGRSGLGGAAVPDALHALDRRFWAHSAEDIDFAALAGRSVVVIGAGASAMDNAATALEADAARVDILIRRAAIPAVNKLTGIGSPGTVHGLAAIPGKWKVKIHEYAARMQVPPPRHSTLRVSRHPNAHFQMSCTLIAADENAGRLRLETNRGCFSADYVIAATGFRNDFDGVPALAAIAPHVRRWGDRVDFPEDVPHDGPLGKSPDLASDFTFRERKAGDCPMLSRIHCFNDAAMLSHGKVSGDIPAVSTGAKRLSRAIVSTLFREDIDAQFSRLKAYNKPELLGDEWAPADSLPD